MADQESGIPLLSQEGGIRQRSRHRKAPQTPEDFTEAGNDSTLPYDGKVFLARRKKPDPLWVNVVEVLVILGVICFAYYAIFYFEHLHFHLARGYAHLGYSSAQHQVAQRYLNGRGVEKDQHLAMHWFKKAADQGHPHASFNLALGHMKGIRKDLLQPGEMRTLFEHAAANGVQEANHVLTNACDRGKCD